jgi:predicted ATP-binding protein involved in virulence
MFIPFLLTFIVLHKSTLSLTRCHFPLILFVVQTHSVLQIITDKAASGRLSNSLTNKSAPTLLSYELNGLHIVIESNILKSSEERQSL